MKAMQCVKCQKNTSLRWFFFSGFDTDHRCIKCGTLLKWSKRRIYFGMLVAALPGPIVVLTESLIPFDPWRILVALIVPISLLALLPGQIMEADESEPS